MADGRQRERAIEEMLKHGVGAPPSPSAPSACVDGETLAAWSSGALARNEAARIEEHLAECVRCQSMLAAFVRTDPVATAPASWWRRAQLGWLVPLATAATVAAIWVAIPERAEPPQPAELAQAPSEQRFDRELRVTPNQPAPSVSAPSAPRPRQNAAPRREAPAASEGKQESSAAPRRADELEADARARVGDRTAEERAATTPPPAGAAGAAAAPTKPTESVAAEAESARLLARVDSAEIVSPGGAIRWRIIAGQIQRSTTGKSWVTATVPFATITAGQSPAASVAWFVGRAGAIFVTTDGTRYEQVPFVSATDLVSVVAIDGRQATVTTEDGRRYRTTDRGLTWIEP